MAPFDDFVRARTALAAPSTSDLVPVVAAAGTRKTTISQLATAIVDLVAGAADGVAPLDGSSLIPDSFIPSTIARDAEVTAAVSAAVNALVDSAPGLLDTLNEIAAALGDDPNFAATMTTALAGKVAAATYNAHTILAATTDDTPAALTVGEQTLVGRITGGNIAALTPSQVRTLLGLVIGTDVQAFHANLTAFAGLSLVADRLPYANGTGTLALTTLSSFIRTLLDDGDAGTARLTLGAAPSVRTHGTGLATTGSQALDFSTLNGTLQSVSASGNLTYTTSNLAAGRSLTLRIIAGGSSRTLTFPSWVWLGAGVPVSIASGKTGVLSLTSFGTTDADVVAAWAVQP